MEIAPDFFDYFEATAALMEKDKFVVLTTLSFYTKSPNSAFLEYSFTTISFKLWQVYNGCFLVEWQWTKAICTWSLYVLSSWSCGFPFFFHDWSNCYIFFTRKIPINAKFLFCRYPLSLWFLPWTWMDVVSVNMGWTISKVAKGISLLALLYCCYGFYECIFICFVLSQKLFMSIYL